MHLILYTNYQISFKLIIYEGNIIKYHVSYQGSKSLNYDVTKIIKYHVKVILFKTIIREIKKNKSYKIFYKKKLILNGGGKGIRINVSCNFTRKYCPKLV